MMEFFLSKIWTVLFGLALVATLLSSFDSIDIDSQNRDMKAELEGIMGVLEGLSELPRGSSMAISLERLIREGEILEMDNGYLTLTRNDVSLRGNNRVRVVAVLEKGVIIEDFRIRLNHESMIFMERSWTGDDQFLRLHLAKSSMISFSTLTKR